MAGTFEMKDAELADTREAYLNQSARLVLADARIRVLEAELSGYKASHEQHCPSIARIRELESANAHLREAMQKQADWLVKAVQVIEWKSLYPKAEMGWYALALVDEIMGRDYRDLEGAAHGKRWYECQAADREAEHD